MDSLDNPLAEARAEILVPSVGIREDMPFFTKRLGFRLDQIFPADDPTVAVLSGPVSYTHLTLPTKRIV